MSVNSEDYIPFTDFKGVPYIFFLIELFPVKSPKATCGNLFKTPHSRHFSGRILTEREAKVSAVVVAAVIGVFVQSQLLRIKVLQYCGKSW